MNRNIRICGKKGSSFRQVHRSSSGQVPHLKGNLKNQHWSRRGQAKMVGVQKACLEERMSKTRDIFPGQEKGRNTVVMAKALLGEEAGILWVVPEA